MLSSISIITEDIKSQADPVRAKNSAWFFKTKPGQYGEGDKFLGLTVPLCRQLARKYPHLSLSDISTLLESEFHEIRLISLLILVSKFVDSDDRQKKQIFDFYIQNTKYVNNWDLVDLTAHKIVGGYLFNKPRHKLYKLAKSPVLWERRISIISCFYFLKYGQFEDAVKLSEILLSDQHDLIHKAVGWVLREVGKLDKKILINFLKQNYPKLPRTTLRYAIEKFPPEIRKSYLLGNFGKIANI